MYGALLFKYDFLKSGLCLIKLKNGLLFKAGPYVFIPNNYSRDTSEFAIYSSFISAYLSISSISS